MRHLVTAVIVVGLFSGIFGCEPPGPDTTVCSTNYDPVCGADGKTYSNACEADKAGVKFTKGECKPKSCGARAGDTCSNTEYCAYEPGAWCGWADAQSVCKPRPQACTLQYSPVCGCDGKTYGNSCSANAAGTGVLKSGPCDVDVVGDWSGKNPDAGWEVQFTFNNDGSFVKRDLVAPCPADVVCVWSGIITNNGSYKVDTTANKVLLTFESSNDFSGVTLPSSLSINSGTGTTLVETLSSGNSVTYTQSN